MATSAPMSAWNHVFGTEFQKAYPDQEFLESEEYEAELLAFADYERPDAEFGDLDNEVHPLLGQLIHQPGWLPFLRLASKVLQEPSLLPYWHALICVEHSQWEDHSMIAQTPVTFFQPLRRDLTAEEVIQTEKALNHASSYLFWICSSDQEDSDETGDESSGEERSDDATSTMGYQRGEEDGLTMRVPNGHPVFPPRTNVNPPGTAAWILIDCFYAKALGPLSCLTDAQKLRVGYHLTQTIIHEIAHALFIIRWPLIFCDARCGYDTHESFFSLETEVELGFATETVFWGGDTSLSREGRYIIHMARWPNLQWRTTGLTPKGLMYLGRRGPRQWRTRYVLPMNWIEKQFRKEFWETEFRESGPQALIFPKQLGLRYFNRFWKESDDGYNSDASSLARYEDEELIVRENNPPRPDWRRPIGRDVSERRWPKLGAVLNSWLGKYYFPLRPDQQYIYAPYSGAGVEPTDRAWQFPAYFVREGPPYKLFVDETRTAPLDLDRRYFDILNIRSDAQHEKDEADKRAFEAAWLAGRPANSNADPPRIY